MVFSGPNWGKKKTVCGMVGLRENNLGNGGSHGKELTFPLGDQETCSADRPVSCYHDKSQEKGEGKKNTIGSVLMQGKGALY